MVIFWVQSHGQNIGIGTDFPTANLEVRHPGLAVIKISTPGSFDTSRLLFSNKSGPYGAEMGISLVGSEGLFIGSFSDLQGAGNDSLVFISPYGMVGINRRMPQATLDVNGEMRSEGLRVNNYGLIELGYGLEKQFDNGRIGLNVFGENNTLSIVGGGIHENASDRRIKFWADSVADFTGRGFFAKNVGIGTTPTASMLTVQAPGSGLLSLRNSNPLANGVSAALIFGGSNYTTGIIQTIGTSSSNARMAFTTGYSFSGGVSNLVERLTISNAGNIGININAPAARLHIKGGNIEKWLSISNNNKEVFKVDSTGVKYDLGKSNYYGAAFINSSEDGVGRWGFATVGGELTKSADQAIAPGVATKINFDGQPFDHNNIIPFDGIGYYVGSVDSDDFRMGHRGIAMIEFEVKWAGSPGGLGGGGLRNAAIIIKKNGIETRRFEYAENSYRDRLYIPCQENDIITFFVYHEHCIDPPPLCLTGIARTLIGARVTVINL
jgi:hypothetical protein